MHSSRELTELGFASLLPEVLGSTIVLGFLCQAASNYAFDGLPPPQYNGH
jgi:hypothetical protein